VSSEGCTLACAGDKTQLCCATTCVLVIDPTLVKPAPGGGELFVMEVLLLGQIIRSGGAN